MYTVNKYEHIPIFQYLSNIQVISKKKIHIKIVKLNLKLYFSYKKEKNNSLRKMSLHSLFPNSSIDIEHVLNLNFTTCVVIIFESNHLFIIIYY